MQYGGRCARWGRVIGMAALLAGAASTAPGNVSLDVVTWSSGDTLGWMSQDGTASLVTAPDSGGNPDGYLAMTFSPSDPPQVQTDHLVNTGERYVGNLSAVGVSALNFDFMGQALGLQYVYFVGGGSTWEHLLDVTTASWQSYSVSLTDSAEWLQTDGTASFEAALADVNLVGFALTFSDAGSPFSYGVDNWQYQGFGGEVGAVPEPETLLFGVTLLATAGLLVGRRIGRVTTWIRPKPDKL